jgi:signal transduction histidine kinase
MHLAAEQDHVVQFYDTEEFLCDRVAEFLGEGLAGGEPIVVIASDDRQRSFQSRLSARGFAVAGRDPGRLTWLDAHRTLAQFMVGTMPDWTRFRQVIGPSLERSAAAGRHPRVRAYGEMVDILWKAGNPQGALRLEEMWNELRSTHSFQLMCAYVMGSFYKSHEPALLKSVCDTHGQVLPGESAAPAARATEELSGRHAVQALVAEIRQRQLVEESLRQSVRDLRDSEARERAAARRLERLQRATARLAGALSGGEVAQALLGLSEEVLGAVAAVVYLREEASGQMRLAGARGVPDADERFGVLDPDADVPLARAMARGEPLWYQSHAELLRAYPPAAQARTPGAHLQAVAAVPLLHDGRVLGGFALSFAEPRTFDDEDRQWLAGFAAQAALAAERARLYQAEKRAVQELTETVRLNELFSGVLAHDLRNPLGAILTAAQLAIMRVEKNDLTRLAAPLNRMLSSGRRMARMVDQLLDLSRVRLGVGMQLDPRPLDLRAVLADVRGELADGQPEAAIDIESLGAPEGQWDEDRLCQVFSNLVGNALIHGRAGVGVRIRLDGTAADQVRVSVHNQGVVPAELMPALFQPLARLERRGEKPQGLGLGLFIAAQIVKAHGGQIAVESSEEAGTTFVVTLPRGPVRGSHDHG